MRNQIGNRLYYILTAGAFLVTSAQAAPAVYQNNSATPQKSKASVTVKFSKAQVEGDLNVVVVGWSDAVADVTSVTDSSGNSYNLAVGPLSSPEASQAIFYAYNIAAGSNSVTVNFSRAATYPDIRIAEFSGISKENPLEAVAQSSGSPDAASSGDATTSVAGELIVGAGTTSGSFTEGGSGFSVIKITSPDADIIEYEVSGQPGSYAATGVQSGNEVMQMAAFLPEGAVASPSPSPTQTASPSPSPSPTKSVSPSPSPSPSPTKSVSPSPSPSPSPTKSVSPSPSPSPTPTPTPTPTQSLSGTGIVAQSCAQSDVQNAINSAINGEVVNVPGPCSVTWSGLSIPATVGITLNGNGATIAGSDAIVVNSNASTPTRITGFNFTGIGDDNGGDVSVTGSYTSAPYRIDDNTFTNSGQSVFISVAGSGAGLIDHNTFTAGGGSETIHNVALGASDGSGWTDNVTPGGANMVYIENNAFNNTDTVYMYSAIESYYGARTVFRYNTLLFAGVDQHGTAGMIGARWWEFYENTFLPNSLNFCCYAALRGGTGVFFNNHVVGSPEYGPADADAYYEPAGTYVWPGAWQPGSGINGGVNQHSNCGTTNSAPMYFWGNDAAITIDSQTPTYVEQGRDYFVSATQPASMQWQEQVGDTCSTTYQYVPFAYPYPLDGNGMPNP